MPILLKTSQYFAAKIMMKETILDMKILQGKYCFSNFFFNITYQMPFNSQIIGQWIYSWRRVCWRRLVVCLLIFMACVSCLFTFCLTFFRWSCSHSWFGNPKIPSHWGRWTRDLDSNRNGENNKQPESGWCQKTRKYIRIYFDRKKSLPSSSSDAENFCWWHEKILVINERNCGSYISLLRNFNWFAFQFFGGTACKTISSSNRYVFVIFFIRLSI